MFAELKAEISRIESVERRQLSSTARKYARRKNRHKFRQDDGRIYRKAAVGKTCEAANG